MKWFHNQRIIVPFDFSEDSIEAVRVAREIANSPTDVHIVHILAEMPAHDPLVTFPEDDVDDKRRNLMSDRIRERLKDLDIEACHVDVGSGDPGSRIAELAEEIEAGLIIIPTHGRQGIRRLFMGSVAERVVRLAHCPVLVLKES